jgi:hypothetical protein
MPLRRYKKMPSRTSPKSPPSSCFHLPNPHREAARVPASGLSSRLAGRRSPPPTLLLPLLDPPPLMPPRSFFPWLPRPQPNRKEEDVSTTLRPACCRPPPAPFSDQKTGQKTSAAADHHLPLLPVQTAAAADQEEGCRPTCCCFCWTTPETALLSDHNVSDAATRSICVWLRSVTFELRVWYLDLLFLYALCIWWCTDTCVNTCCSCVVNICC